MFRKNNSSESTISRDRIYAEGGFKYVYKGTYTKGQRRGQACVSKVFKDGPKYSADYFECELEVVNRAGLLIEKFNESKFIDKTIYLNEPQIWSYVADGEKNLVEPFIDNFEKFNSNTGWKLHNGTPWNLVMQALSHFSYHISSGQFLLCDLQGGIYRDGIVLTDPIVTSANRRYGPADLGMEGIKTFFARHNCNRYCRYYWTKPKNPQTFYPCIKGSTFESARNYGNVPTRRSRPAMTQVLEEESEEYIYI